MMTNKVDECEFTRLYNDGRTPREIADAMGIAFASVRGIRRRLKLPPFRRASRNVKHGIDHYEFMKLYSRGYYAQQIADELKIAPSNIYRYRAKLGLAPFPQPPKARTNYGGGGKRLDRELILSLDREGMSARQIAAAIGTNPKSIHRIRREMGISKSGPPKQYPEQTKNAVCAMLLDGTSYAEVGRTFDIPAARIRKWFPGMGWTPSEAAQYKKMKEKLDSLA